MRTTVGYVPIPVKKQAARESPCDLLTNNSSHPRLAMENETARKTPRFLSLSEAYAKAMVDIAEATYTGTVRSCVVRVLYPNVLTMRGRKLLKADRLTFIMQ
jgi:hypothetical protein